jgi:hypothetical protein
MLEQRGADAAVAASADDAGVAGLETAVLELPSVSHRPASEADAVWSAGGETAHDGLVGVAPALTEATPPTTVRARGCSVRKSPMNPMNSGRFRPFSGQPLCLSFVPDGVVFRVVSAKIGPVPDVLCEVGMILTGRIRRSSSGCQFGATSAYLLGKFAVRPAVRLLQLPFPDDPRVLKVFSGELFLAVRTPIRENARLERLAGTGPILAVRPRQRGHGRGSSIVR